jgi:hypothetical protein
VSVLSVRVPDDLAESFDAAAAATGGRSALLHRLVREAATKAPRGAPAASPARDAMRLMVRLAPAEAAHVAAEAATMAMPRAAWVAALVRRHTIGAPRFSRLGELALIATHGEVRRIGINVNQIARALNTAVLEGRVLDTELSSLDDLRRELRDHMEGLGEALRGNLAYWAP